MASVLHNIVKRPAETNRTENRSFRTISRTDGKTSSPQMDSSVPRRSGPKRCPVCGATTAENPVLFICDNGIYECRECRAKFGENGSIMSIRVEPSSQTDNNVPRRSGPRKCPLCGTTTAEKPMLFICNNGVFECTECRTRISETGTVMSMGVYL